MMAFQKIEFQRELCRQTRHRLHLVYQIVQMVAIGQDQVLLFSEFYSYFLSSELTSFQ